MQSWHQVLRLSMVQELCPKLQYPHLSALHWPRLFLQGCLCIVSTEFLSHDFPPTSSFPTAPETDISGAFTSIRSFKRHLFSEKAVGKNTVYYCLGSNRGKNDHRKHLGDRHCSKHSIYCPNTRQI